MHEDLIERLRKLANSEMTEAQYDTRVLTEAADALAAADAKIAELEEEGMELLTFRGEVINPMLAQARKDALEEAAEEALRVWREASNERTDSAATSYLQNRLGNGCCAAAKAIRALIDKPTVDAPK